MSLFPPLFYQDMLGSNQRSIATVYSLYNCDRRRLIEKLYLPKRGGAEKFNLIALLNFPLLSFGRATASKLPVGELVQNQGGISMGIVYGRTLEKYTEAPPLIAKLLGRLNRLAQTT
jgi:hypothetical protein